MKLNLKFTSRAAVAALATGCCLTALAQGDPSMTNKERATTDSNIKKDMPAVMKGMHEAKGVPATDVNFLKTAAMGGIKEVEMGKQAEKMGTSPEVKKIGARMVADHTMMNKEVMTLAKQKGIKLAKAAPMDLKGSTFDKDYLSMMMMDHTKDVADFTKEAKAGQDPEIKALAAKGLPTIKSHLAMVKDASKKVK